MTIQLLVQYDSPTAFFRIFTRSRFLNCKRLPDAQCNAYQRTQESDVGEHVNKQQNFEIDFQLDS